MVVSEGKRPIEFCSARWVADQKEDKKKERSKLENFNIVLPS